MDIDVAESALDDLGCSFLLIDPYALRIMGEVCLGRAQIISVGFIVAPS